MTISLGFEDSSSVEVASNLGWSQFTKWAECIEGVPEVSCLLAYGWSNSAEAVRQGIEESLGLVRDDNVKSVAGNVLSVLNGLSGPVVITNGISPLNESEGSVKPSPFRRTKALIPPQSDPCNDLKLIPVPDLAQPTHFDCGRCAAEGVGKFYGVGPESDETWEKILGTNVKKSTNPKAIISVLTSLGLQVEARDNLSLDDLKGYWERGWPVIVPCQDYGTEVPKKADFAYGHYLTFIGGPALGYVFFQDSSADNVLKGSDTDAAPGKVMIDVQTWLKVWHDKDADGNKFVRYGIAVGPPIKEGTKDLSDYQIKKERDDGNWRTIEGTHVHFDKPHGGEIDKGPPALKGKKPSELKPRAKVKPGKVKSGKNKPKPHKTNETPFKEQDKNPATSVPPTDSASKTRDHVIDSAKSSPVKATNHLGGGANESMIVELEDGFKGVFKPEDGEDQSLRDSIKGYYYAREAAASGIANILGLDDLVPTTFVREVNGKKGSVQQFVPDAAVAQKVPDKERYDGKKDLARAAAFDYLIGNTDRHTGNWMITKGGRLTLIDHGLSFPEEDPSTLGSEGWCNADLMNYAAQSPNSDDSDDEVFLKLPDFVKTMKWDDIDRVLTNEGLHKYEIEATRKRFDQLKSGVEDFRQLRKLTTKYSWV